MKCEKKRGIQNNYKFWTEDLEKETTISLDGEASDDTDFWFFVLFLSKRNGGEEGRRGVCFKTC